jgi:hypothetical protein
MLHCNGHRISDSPDLSVRGLEIRNTRRFTERACQLATVNWNIADSSDGRIVDNEIGNVPTIATQPLFWILRSPRVVVEFNKITNVAIVFSFSSDATVTDNDFSITAGDPAVTPFHVGSSCGGNTRILRNEFDGGWDGIALLSEIGNAVDDAIVIQHEANALVRHNYMENYWDAGFEWAGRLENSLIESNVIVNAGVTAIGGWYWSSVSGTRFVQNLPDRSSRLFYAFRVQGLRPANFVGNQPADVGVHFRNNICDRNVQRNQRKKTIFGGDVGVSSLLPVFSSMFYGGTSQAYRGSEYPPMQNSIPPTIGFYAMILARARLVPNLASQTSFQRPA